MDVVAKVRGDPYECRQRVACLVAIQLAQRHDLLAGSSVAEKGAVVDERVVLLGVVSCPGPREAGMGKVLHVGLPSDVPGLELSPEARPLNAAVGAVTRDAERRASGEGQVVRQR